MVPWHHGNMVPCYHGAMVPWHHGKMFMLLGWKRDKFQPRCCEADFGSIIKILGYPLGRSASFSEIHLFRLVPGLKIDFFEKLSQVSRVAEMVTEKNCLHFWGPNPSKVAKNVARPILARESRFWGIRWGDRHHFSRSICSDWSRHPKSTFSKIQSPKWLVLRGG